jgi:hypothetical protein
MIDMKCISKVTPCYYDRLARYWQSGGRLYATFLDPEGSGFPKIAWKTKVYARGMGRVLAWLRGSVMWVCHCFQWLRDIAKVPGTEIKESRIVKKIRTQLFGMVWL